VNVPLLVLVLADFAVIGVLPRVFFKRGSFNRGWWLTALPFFACPLFLLAATLAGWRSWAGAGGALPAVLGALAGLLVGGSIALLVLTLGTHRVPLALWHQDDDAPASIVTHGSYARIRHPFYAAFLLAFVAAVALFPHLATIIPLCYAAVRLNATAAREERRLAASEFGEAYRAYVSRTGRFLPARFLPRSAPGPRHARGSRPRVPA
jgi:protein-S-isoprenylcysteine O-methyltransferase Ste14